MIDKAALLLYVLAKTYVNTYQNWHIAKSIMGMDDTTKTLCEDDEIQQTPCTSPPTDTIH